MLNQWILIGALAISTYLSRIIGVEIMAGRKLSPGLRLYFNYVPIAIISALIVKQVFIPSEGHLVLSLPVLISCLTAAIMIKMTKMFLLSVMIGILLGVLSRYFL